jgi:hypothetical protein
MATTVVAEPDGDVPQDLIRLNDMNHRPTSGLRQPRMTLTTKPHPDGRPPDAYAEKMSSSGPVATFYAPADAGWAACLTVDLRARGVHIWDTQTDGFDRTPVATDSAGMLIVHSHSQLQRGPSQGEVKAVSQRGGPVVVVRRNDTKMSMDDYPFQKAVMALWGDYYQPEPSTNGDVRSRGFANLLGMFGGATGPMPPGYVFISYRAAHDRQFVQDHVRSVLALAGYPSWDYRMSERIIDEVVTERLRERLQSAAALLVVATEAWSSEWTGLELATAVELNIPILAVRPARTRACSDAALDRVPVHILAPGDLTGRRLISAIQEAGVAPLAL